MNSVTSLKKSSLATALAVVLGAGTAHAAFFAPNSTGTIRATAGCFTFGDCTIGSPSGPTTNGNIPDNATTITRTSPPATFGSGIASDGYVAVWNFTVGSDGNTITITSFSQDPYLDTAGGTFALFAPSGTSSMTGNVSDSGRLTLDLTGRAGTADFFSMFDNGGLGTQWNIDNSTKPGPRTGLQKLLTTGTSINYYPSTAGGHTAGDPNVTLVGSDLGSTSATTWSGTLVSAGNIGTAWGTFNGTPYTEKFNITVTGTAATCNPDTCPDNFTFGALTDQELSQLVVSNSQTITGMISGTPISITNGEYQIDSGSWTSTSGTINPNQQVRVRHTTSSQNSTLVVTALTIGNLTKNFTSTTKAVAGTQGSNFTMLDPSGAPFGGTNDVVATWNGTHETDVNSTNFGAMTLSSTTPFFSFNWTAHHIRVFGPGTYTIDTTCTVAQIEGGNSSNCGNALESGQTQRYYTFTVGTNQLAAHMLFDWNAATNIDVVDVFNQNAVFGPSNMFTGAAGCNNKTQVWDLMSSDWDSDGQNGAGMIDGPFKGYKANFNIRINNAALSCSSTPPVVNVADPSGAGGCSINPSPVNALQRGDWWLIGGFLIWLGAIKRRLQRQHQA